MRPSTFFVLSVLLLGCGGNGAPPIAARHARDASLAIWTTDARGAPLSVPRAEVHLGGQPVEVMIDTGASQHFVLGAAAWAYRVESSPFAVQGTDAYGSQFSVRMAERGSLRIPAFPWTESSSLFVLDSHPLWSNGILGGLAPQLLAPRGHAALLDLREGRLDVVPADALSDADRAMHGRVCRAGRDARDGWRYVVPVEIGERTVQMMVDTGAQGTLLYTSSPVAADFVVRGAPHGVVRVSGAASVAQMLLFDDVGTSIGGALLRGRAALGPGEPQCGEDGVLGFDRLRYCRLAMRRDGIAITCEAVEPEPRAPPPRASFDPVVLRSFQSNPACGHSAEELRPAALAWLPHAFRTPVDAYVALHESADAHASHLERECRNEGYLEARIREPVLWRWGSRLLLHFGIDEGRRFTIGEVSVLLLSRSGERQERLASELPWLRTRAGRPYREDDVHLDARALADALSARGVHVAETYFGRALHEDATVDVRFAMDLEGAIPPPDEALTPPR
jgi:hypothetical protein